MAEGGTVTLWSLAMPTTLTEHAERLNLRCGQSGRLPPLILVTDSERLADPVPAIARLRSGDAVLFRHYALPDRADLAHAIAKVCRARRVSLIIGADHALARTVGAAGIHYPQALTPLGHRPPNTQGLLLTVAAHDERALAAAYRMGADAALLSPVFPTESHPGASALGVNRFARLVRESRVAVYGLGGITAANARRLVGSGAAGIAAVGAFSR